MVQGSFASDFPRVDILLAKAVTSRCIPRSQSSRTLVGMLIVSVFTLRVAVISVFVGTRKCAVIDAALISAMCFSESGTQLRMNVTE